MRFRTEIVLHFICSGKKVEQPTSPSTSFSTYIELLRQSHSLQTDLQPPPFARLAAKCLSAKNPPKNCSVLNSPLDSVGQIYMCHTTQHRAVLILFPLNLQTITMSLIHFTVTKMFPFQAISIVVHSLLRFLQWPTLQAPLNIMSRKA